MFFEPSRLSYQSAALIAERIAKRVKTETEDKIVVITGTPLLADFANLQAVFLLLRSLQMDYEVLATQAASLCKRKLC